MLKIDSRVMTLGGGDAIPFYEGWVLESNETESLVLFDIGERSWINNKLLADLTIAKENEKTSDFTRKEFGKFIISQMDGFLETIGNLEEKNVESKIIISSYNDVYTAIVHEIRTDKIFDEDFQSRIKRLIHLSDSCVAGITAHYEEYNDHYNSLLFGYFYSIIDTMYNYESWGFKK